MTDKDKKEIELILSCVFSQIKDGLLDSAWSVYDEFKKQLKIYIDSMQEEWNITGVKSKHATGKLKECIDNAQKAKLIAMLEDALSKETKESWNERLDKNKPKFKVGDTIKPIDSCLGSPRVVKEVKDGWYYTDRGTIDFEYEDNWELVEEPVECNTVI